MSFSELLGQASNKSLSILFILFLVVAIQKGDSNIIVVKYALKVINNC
jgi:hypothetical protein